MFHGRCANQFVAHVDVDLAFSNELDVLRYVAVLHYGGACRVAFHFEVANKLVDYFVRHVAETVEVAQHHAAKLSKVVLVVADPLTETLVDVWESQFKFFDVLQVERSAMRLLNSCDSCCAFEFSKDGQLTKQSPFLEICHDFSLNTRWLSGQLFIGVLFEVCSHSCLAYDV